jgi:hypothetical protein
MIVRLLGPKPERLEELRPVWKKIIEDLKLKPGQAGKILEKADEKREARGVLGGGKLLDRLLKVPFEEDTSEANGSSIAVLLEYRNRRLLCSGDAFAEDLTEAVELLAKEDGLSRLSVTAVKLSHHGGRKNTSVAMIGKLRCPQWLVSTDGSTYDHPDDESLARVVRHADVRRPATLCFNYSSNYNARWRHRRLQTSEKFRSKAPPPNQEGLTLNLAIR